MRQHALQVKVVRRVGGKAAAPSNCELVSLGPFSCCDRALLAIPAGQIDGRKGSTPHSASDDVLPGLLWC